MLWKKEHSVGGRQYNKRKRSAKSEEKEGPIQKSKHLKGKVSTTQPKETEPEKELNKEMEPEEVLSEISLGGDLPDVSWTKSK